MEAHAARAHSRDNQARGDGKKKEEAEWPCSQGHQQSVSNVILYSKNGVTQPTACVQRKPGEAVPGGPSIYNNESELDMDNEGKPKTKVVETTQLDHGPSSADHATHESVDVKGLPVFGGGQAPCGLQGPRGHPLS